MPSLGPNLPEQAINRPLNADPKLSVLYFPPMNSIVFEPSAGTSARNSSPVRVRILDARANSPTGISDTELDMFGSLVAEMTFLETIADSTVADKIAAAMGKALQETHQEWMAAHGKVERDEIPDGLIHNFKNVYERAKKYR